MNQPSPTRSPYRPDPIAGIYFAFFFGIGIFCSFIYLYYQRLGLSPGQIKVLAVIGPLVAILFQPLWGMLADLLAARRAVIFVCALVNGAVTLGFLLTESYHYLLVIVAVFYLFWGAVLPLANSGAVADSNPAELGFGRRRLWGTVSFIVASLIAGQVTELFSLRAIFPMYALAMALTAGFALMLPRTGPRPAPRVKLLAGVKGLIGKWDMLWFFCGVALLGVAIEGNFVTFGLMWDVRGGSISGLGLAWALGAVIEIPLFFWGAKLLIERSPLMALLAAALLGSLRWYLIAIIADTRVLTLLQPIHGVMFACYLWGGIQYINNRSGAEIKNTGQGILAAITVGFAMIAGNLLGAHVYQYWGVARVYQVFTVFSLAAACLFVTAGIAGKRAARGSAQMS